MHSFELGAFDLKDLKQYQPYCLFFLYHNTTVWKFVTSSVLDLVNSCSQFQRFLLTDRARDSSALQRLKPYIQNLEEAPIFYCFSFYTNQEKTKDSVVNKPANFMTIKLR